MPDGEWYCRYCHTMIGEDWIEVEPGPDGAYHVDCARKISDAYLEQREEIQGKVSPGWDLRATNDRLDVVEDLARRTASVWRLWLTDARKGAINPGTFDAMANLLGMDKP